MRRGDHGAGLGAEARLKRRGSALPGNAVTQRPPDDASGARAAACSQGNFRKIPTITGQSDRGFASFAYM
jgi:hypothetical protein